VGTPARRRRTPQGSCSRRGARRTSTPWPTTAWCAGSATGVETTAEAAMTRRVARHGFPAPAVLPAPRDAHPSDLVLDLARTAARADDGGSGAHRRADRVAGGRDAGRAA